MRALDAELVTPDESIADLEKRWGISRNALKARARALGVELIRQGPTLTVWPGDRIAEADRLDAHLKAGGAMASFPGVAGSDGSQAAVTPQGGSDSSKLAVSGKTDQLAVLAAAVAAAMPQAPVDPLARARGLAEAADNALVLCNEDLSALLGQGVSAWSDGTERFGYRFRRHQQGRQVLWVVERAVAVSGKLAAVSGRAKRVGFATAEVVEARVEVLSTGAALFASNLIG